MEEATLSALIMILLMRGSVAICSFDDPSLSLEDQAECIRAWITRYHQNINEKEMKFSSNTPGNEEDSVVDNDMTSKRGKLDQNFLRFGRFPPLDSTASGKRTQLDRNFLRFGRSVDHVLLKRNVEENESSDRLEFSPSERQKKNSPKIRLPKSLLNPAHLNLFRELSWKRGALERNFLRFGRSDTETPTGHHLEKRSNLDRNFLRFGRSQAREKESLINEGMINDNNFRKEEDNEWQEEENKSLEQEKMLTDEQRGNEMADDDFQRKQQKKASLNKNFLRFGRTSQVECLDESNSNCLMISDNSKRASLNKNFLRFGKRLAEEQKRAPLDRNFLRFGRRRDEEREPFLSSFPMDMKRASLNKNFLRFGRYPFDNEEFAEDEKRNRLNKNFLRFGRTNDLEDSTWRMDMEENKRAPLDRNFLRFGKRSVDTMNSSRNVNSLP